LAVEADGEERAIQEFFERSIPDYFRRPDVTQASVHRELRARELHLGDAQQASPLRLISQALLERSCPANHGGGYGAVTPTQLVGAGTS
jgi:hypothetical protein